MVTDAIAAAELKTSGEIRVHLENFCFGNALRAAEKVFLRLKMHETRERNGVLIYVATQSRKIAIAGDRGIHEKLGSGFWEKMAAQLIERFQHNQKAEALAECILACGEQLGRYFPRSADDTNELTNSISY